MKKVNLRTDPLIKKLNRIFIMLSLPILLINILITSSDIREIETDMDEGVNTQMEYFLGSLDETYNRISRMVGDLYTDRDTLYVATAINVLDSYEAALSVKRIESNKNTIESSDSLIKEIKIYIPSIELVLQNTRIHFGNVIDMSAEEIREYAAGKEYGKPVSHNGSLTVFYPYVLGDEVFMLTEVIMDQDKIMNELEHAVVYDSYYRFEATSEPIVFTNVTEDIDISKFRRYRHEDHKHGMVYEVYLDSMVMEASYWSAWRMTGLIILLYVAVMIVFYLTSGKTVKEPMEALYNTVDQQELLLKRAELKQLQTQITPHFLYNTLFLLRSLIKGEEYDQAEQLAGDLGKYYRYITRNATDFVDLKDEDDHARIYADIQTTRFAGRIDVEYQSLPEELDGIKVPRLIIQPLLENAFGHGLEGRTEGGLLRVSYRYNEELTDISIFVEDNGLSLTDDELAYMIADLERGSREDGEVTGTINIHKRLRMNYGPESGLILSRSELGGLCIEIRIIKEENENNGGTGNDRESENNAGEGNDRENENKAETSNDIESENNAENEGQNV